MKKLYKLLFKIFPFSKEADAIAVDGNSFFDYSSSKKIKLMRAAGRDAQKEQQKLLKDYDSRFGQV